MRAALLALGALALTLTFAGSFSGLPAVSATALPSPLPPCGTALYTPTPGSPVNAGPMGLQLNHTENCTVQPANNITAYGVACDGVTDNSGTLPGLVFPVFIPFGAVCFTNQSFSALPDGRFFGNSGTLETVESAVNQPRARSWTVIATPPAGWTSTNVNFIGTAFTGDMSHQHMVWGTYVKGAATLTQPTTGYNDFPITAGVYGYYTNTSGWNQDTGDNIGRTATNAYYTALINNGNGDINAYHCVSTVGGTGKAGATTFLANPNAGCFSGNVQANSAGMYLNPYEVLLSDQGHDVAAVGMVNRFNRSVNTGALGTIWQGIDIQSEGTSIDSAFFASGAMTIGLDLTPMNISSPVPGAAAIAFGANNCIYTNATNPGGPNQTHFSRYTVLGNDCICYNTTDGAMEMTDNGVVTLESKGGSTPGVLLTQTVNKGLLSCTPSASTTCGSAPTATVLSGAVCTASYDATTAATASTLVSPLVGVSGTTLTITPRTTTSQSALLAVDYVCL